MTELSPEARALLEEARRSHGPSEHDRERVLSTLHASLGIAVPLALASSVAEAATEAAGSNIAEALDLAGQSLAQSVAQSGAQLTQAGHGAFQTSAQGALGYASKLLTWKAGKILLASVALGSAVGISTLPRSKRVEDDAVAVRTSHAIARPAEREPTGGTGSSGSATPSAPAGKAEPESEPTSAEPVARHADPAARPLQQPPRAQDTAAEPVLVAEPAPSTPSTPSSSARRGSSKLVASSAGARAGSASHRRSTYRTHVHRERVAAAVTPVIPAVSPDPTPAVVAALQADVPAVPGTALPAAELELIRKAMTSLRDRDAERALGLLAEHARLYPSGAFLTERRGLRVVALCAAGREAEGRNEQASFLREHAAAPIAARVRRACLEPKK